MIPDLLRRAAGNAVAGDPYYSAVSLLLHFNGANGSTTFTDSSSNNLTVTPTNATISTTQSKFGGAAGYYNGSAYCTAPTGSLFQFSGDFTIEFWVYPTSSSTFTLFDSRINETAPNGNGFVIGINASAQWVVYYGGNQIVGSTVTTNAWTHVAVTRSGTSVKMFLNGTQTGSTWTTSVNFSDGAFLIGTDYPKNARFFNGYLDDLRITPNVARYTANFTVPSAPYPDRIGSIEADAYFPQTSLLLHMDGTNASTSFVDSGPNALAVTASGNAQISTAQSKFGGASAYFDGNGDQLTLPANSVFAFGTGDFTIEFWVYSTETVSSTRCMFDTRTSGSDSGGIFIRNNGTGGYLFGQASNTIASTGNTVRTPNAWGHLALVRSGTSMNLYFNGTSVASATNSNNFSTNNCRISGFVGATGSTEAFLGYIDELRVTKGVARYTSNFTPRAKAFPDIYNPYKTLPVSGAALWLDGADSSSLFTDAGVTPVKVNGDLVYQWNDKSGNSRHATQTTSGNRPTWVPPASGRNGLGALAFNGSSQWINFTTQSLASCTAFIVYQQNDLTNGSVLIGNGLGGSSGWPNYLAATSNTAFNVNNVQANDPRTNGTQWDYSTFKYNGSTGTVTSYSNSSSGTSATGASGSLSIASIGYYSSTQYITDGKIGEIIIYPSALSDSDRTSVVNYIKAKWGF